MATNHMTKNVQQKIRKLDASDERQYMLGVDYEVYEKQGAPYGASSFHYHDFYEIIYVVSGSIPNLKSTPLVDEWFGLLYKNGNFVKVLDMNDVLQKTGIRSSSLSNTDAITEDEVSSAEALLEDVVEHTKDFLKEKLRDYQNRMNPLLDKEVDKLIELQNKHHEYYQLTLFEHERKLEEKERSIDELFNEFISWVTETLTIQDNPYIRIVAVFSGVSQ